MPALVDRLVRGVEARLLLATGDEQAALDTLARLPLSATTGVLRARHALSHADPGSALRLLEPWLGSGLDLSQLPIPRLIVIRLRGQRSEDLAALRSALALAVPQANLDDHRTWAARIACRRKRSRAWAWRSTRRCARLPRSTARRSAASAGRNSWRWG